MFIDKFEEALSDFNEVIAIQPNNQNAYFGRAFAHKALKHYDRAAEDFEKAKELDPKNPNLVVNYKKIFDVKYIRLCLPGEEMR